MLLLDRTLTWLMATLSAVPATFWGVIVGSFFTLLGGYVTNRASDRRQRSQFQHEFTLKREERELALRKDIYLAAAEAIQEGAIALGSLSNLEVASAEATKGLLARLPAVAKVQVIARGDTLRAVAEASGFLSAALLRLMGRRLPLDIARGRLRVLQEECAGFGKERDRWLEEMKQHNLAGTPNAQRWAVLQGNHNFEDRRIAEAQARILAETQGLFTAQLDFTAECLAESRQLARLLVPAVLAVRGELGIAIDEREFRAVVQGQLAMQQAATDAFLETARAALVQPEQAATTGPSGSVPQP